MSGGYDLGGRLNAWTDTLAGTTLPKLGFGYDASGNRSLIRRNHFTTTSEAMAYQTDNQLSTWKKGTADASGTIATPAFSQSWTLDSRGNWTGWTQNGTAQARTHTTANELTAMGATTLTWDAAGDLTSDGTLTYIWGPRGALDTVKQGTTVKGFYGYDPLGRRALKTVGSIKTISIYDGWQCVYQKVTGSGTDTTKAYTFANYIDEPVTLIRKWSTSTDTSYYLQGNNYNVEALTDRTGSVIERYEYTPYGKVTVYTGAGTDGKWFTSDDVSATVSAKGNALTFQGRELDAESGNYQFRYRYYQPTLGRFASRDPIRFDAGDINILRFVGGRPLTSLDPLGLASTTSTVSFNLGDDGQVTGSYQTAGGSSSAFDNSSSPMAMANLYLSLKPGKGCNSCVSLKWSQKIYQISNGTRTPASGWSDDGPTEGVGQSAEAKSYWFWDHPQQPLPGYPGENYTFRARLNLSCTKKDGTTKALFSLEWGYGMNGTKLNPYPPRKL